tara:strand:- start:257 stop:943 length:687 start_codon:yes stop_codon:yes gene_type:complete
MKIVYPKIISIETSTELASIAIYFGKNLISYKNFNSFSKKENFFKNLNFLLESANLSLSEFDGIAFGSGPGSFTGIRKACGIAQGIGLGINVKVIPIITLLAMAEAARSKGAGKNIISVLDARMGEVYWAQYLFKKKWKTINGPFISKPKDIKINKESILCGNIFDKDDINLNLFSNIKVVNNIIPHAKYIGKIAYELFDEAIHPREAEPYYLRDNVALKISERKINL